MGMVSHLKFTFSNHMRMVPYILDYSPQSHNGQTRVSRALFKFRWDAHQMTRGVVKACKSVSELLCALIRIVVSFITLTVRCRELIAFQLQWNTRLDSHTLQAQSSTANTNKVESVPCFFFLLSLRFFASVNLLFHWHYYGRNSRPHRLHS